MLGITLGSGRGEGGRDIYYEQNPREKVLSFVLEQFDWLTTTLSHTSPVP
jgi:hypothetical protein